MKKLLALMLCLLLLTACARQEPATGTAAENTPVTSSVTSNSAEVPSALTGENADNTYLVNNNFQCMTESDSAIYKVASDRNHIYYFDKATNFSGPLCGKPDCNHTDENCDAYIRTGIAIQYYNGNLYFVASDPDSFPSGTWLWKADSTGKNREKNQANRFSSLPPVL